jgi:ribosomal protein L19
MLFFSNNFKNDNIIKEAIIERKSRRNNIFFSYNLLKFSVGDILIVFYWVKGLLFRFEGICIALKKKNLLNVNTTLILRNVLSSIGVELAISYYYNRLFYLKFSDFKRKKFIYNRAKLYYLRNKLNRESRIL